MIMLDPEVMKSFFSLREAVNVQIALETRMNEIQVALSTHRKVRVNHPKLNPGGLVKSWLTEKRDLMKAHKLMGQVWKI
jgi:hypothetical protein